MAITEEPGTRTIVEKASGITIQESRMAFALNQAEPVGEGIHRIYLEELALAIDHLDTPAEEQLTGVHEARKTIKRLRALLQAIRPVIGRRAFNRENGRLRAISHHLAPVREAAALVELLEGLAANLEEMGDGLPLTSLTPLLEQLREERDRRIARLIERDLVIKRAQEELERLKTEASHFLGQLLEPSLPQDFRLIAPGIKRTYRQSRRRMKAAYRSYSPEDFHNWRKRVKHHWHQMELLAPGRPEKIEPLLADIHSLSDLLGDAHDFHELQNLLEGGDTRMGMDVAPLVDLLRSRQNEKELAARPLGTVLFAAKPDRFIAALAASWSGGEPPQKDLA